MRDDEQGLAIQADMLQSRDAVLEVLLHEFIITQGFSIMSCTSGRMRLHCAAQQVDHA